MMQLRIPHLILGVAAGVALYTAVFFVTGWGGPSRLRLASLSESLNQKLSGLVSKEPVDDGPSHSGVNCFPNTPCVYPEVVDFRVIVITYNRAVSVMKLLRSLDTVEMDGDSGRLEIWLDRNLEGKVDDATLQAVSGFQWKGGPTRVHVQKRHVGIMGQWINTWSPPDHSLGSTKEIGVIIEDDISVSPQIWRWLKAVHRHYAKNPEFVGATLTSDQQNTADHIPLIAPKNDTVFFYKCLGTWGMSATAYHWHAFQTWFHRIRTTRPDFHPYVEVASTATSWYRGLENSGTQSSMWEMWFVYYAYAERVFTLYNNLPRYNGDKKSCLCINRREVGLHVSGKGPENLCTLLDHWKKEYVVFPNYTTKLDWNAKVITMY